MKRLILSLLSLILLACSNSPGSFIPFFEGYWEINEVTLADGSKKLYQYNDSVDYIEFADSMTGYRRKLKPDFSGSFLTSYDVEKFQLKIENDSLNVYYSTDFSSWKETVLSASEDELLMINEAKVRYLYKRYQPIINADETP